jgi:hypothetical protein
MNGETGVNGEELLEFLLPVAMPPAPVATWSLIGGRAAAAPSTTIVCSSIE